MTNYVYIIGWFRNTYIYIDARDKMYQIDKCIPPYLRWRIKFKQEFTKKEFGKFRVCVLTIPKKFVKEMEPILSRLNNNLMILYGSEYDKILQYFNTNIVQKINSSG